MNLAIVNRFVKVFEKTTSQKVSITAITAITITITAKVRSSCYYMSVLRLLHSNYSNLYYTGRH